MSEAGNNTTIGARDLLANDTDPDNDALTVTDVRAGAGVESVTLNLNGDMVTFVFAPNYEGAGSFSYTVSDGQGGTDAAVASFDVTAPPPPEPITHTITTDRPATEGESLTMTVTASRPVDANTPLFVAATGSAVTSSDIAHIKGNNPFIVGIPAGETTFRGALDIIDDAVVEPTEDITLTLREITANPDGTRYTGPVVDSTTTTILDNDVAPPPEPITYTLTNNGPVVEGIDPVSTFTASRASATDTLLQINTSGSADNPDDVGSTDHSGILRAGETTFVYGGRWRTTL